MMSILACGGVIQRNEHSWRQDVVVVQIGAHECVTSLPPHSKQLQDLGDSKKKMHVRYHCNQEEDEWVMPRYTGTNSGKNAVRIRDEIA